MREKSQPWTRSLASLILVTHSKTYVTEAHSEQYTTHTHTTPHTHPNKDLIKYTATPPNQPHQCILTDYFNSYNFNKLK